MARTTQGRQNGVHSREIGSKTVLFKSFYNTMLWAPVVAQEEDMFCLCGKLVKKHVSIQSESILFVVVLKLVKLLYVWLDAPSYSKY